MKCSSRAFFSLFVAILCVSMTVHNVFAQDSDGSDVGNSSVGASDTGSSESSSAESSESQNTVTEEYQSDTGSSNDASHTDSQDASHAQDETSLDTNNGATETETIDTGDTQQLDPLFDPVTLPDVELRFPLTVQDIVDTLQEETRPDVTVSFVLRDFVIRDGVRTLALDIHQTHADYWVSEPLLDIPSSLPEQVNELVDTMDAATPLGAPRSDASSVDNVVIAEVTPDVQEVIGDVTSQIPESLIVPGQLDIEHAADDSFPVEVTQDNAIQPVASPTATDDVPWLPVHIQRVFLNGNASSYTTDTTTPGTITIFPDISLLDERSFVVHVVADVDGTESAFQIVVEWLPAVEVNYSFGEYSVRTRFETSGTILSVATAQNPALYQVALDPAAMPLGAVIAEWNNYIIWKSANDNAWSLFDLDNGSLSSLTDDPRSHAMGEPEYTIMAPVNPDYIPPATSLPPLENAFAIPVDEAVVADAPVLTPAPTPEAPVVSDSEPVVGDIVVVDVSEVVDGEQGVLVDGADPVIDVPVAQDQDEQL